MNKINEIAHSYQNCRDSYKEETSSLMVNYLADDIVLVLRVVKSASCYRYGRQRQKTWHRENKL